LINLRCANKKDTNILLKWVNNFDSISNKLVNQGPITLYEHKNWLYERLNDTNTYIWIVENKKYNPIGQIRFEKKNSTYYDVDIYIVNEERKKELATKALTEAIKISKNLPLRAIVKKNNLPSYRFFAKNGFLIKSEDKFKWVLIKE
tara:strand:+ start:489 stop:929 length:441 start_codon:yes stop_codon:yes gene_type:complete